MRFLIFAIKIAPMESEQPTIDQRFLSLLTEEQRQIFAGLTSPVKIQAFLDSVPYSAENRNRTPLRVMQDRVAHCLDGALFAAAALRQLGYPPLLIDMLPEPGTDDDHLLAIFKVNGAYGAVAKSNFVGLRYREPVYRTLRELVLSYFEQFFNIDGMKTLRAYSRPVSLKRFDRLGWTWNDAAADAIEQYLYTLHTTPLITNEMASCLSDMDPLTYKAGMLVVNQAGLYKPKK